MTAASSDASYPKNSFGAFRAGSQLGLVLGA